MQGEQLSHPTEVLNPELLVTFAELQSVAEILGDVYQANAHRSVINSIKKIPIKLTPQNINQFIQSCAPRSYTQSPTDNNQSLTDNNQSLTGNNLCENIKLSAKMLEKIRVFITTGRLAELTTANPRVDSFRIFRRILGVGPATINNWLAAGLTDLKLLREALGRGEIKLTHMQKLGLKYYDDLNMRIPRDEVTLIGNIVKGVLISVDPDVIFEIMGSYRRKKSESGDIDVLIANKNHFEEALIPLFIDLISQDPNFIDVVMAGYERTTFLYQSPINGRARQIDLLHVDYGSYFAALNYFTGGYLHNEWLRGIAKKSGYRLNQAGLYKYEGKELKLIPLTNEKQIYEILRAEWVPPEQRS